MQEDSTLAEDDATAPLGNQDSEYAKQRADHRCFLDSLENGGSTRVASHIRVHAEGCL